MSSIKEDAEVFLRKLKKQSSLLENKAAEIQEEGGLKICCDKRGYPHYYHKISDGTNTSTRFLRKDSPIVKELAEKSYYHKLLRALKEEISALENFLKEYHPEKKYMIYDSFTDERKKLIAPIYLSPELTAEAWEKEEWKKYDRFPEKLRHETDKGEMVRSKSERTIANLLYKYKDDLAYRYEQELYLPKSRIYVHPDFTIMNRHTGKIFYWEHAGMMDDEGYAQDFVTKMNGYIIDGMYPAENFLITFETSLIPENTKVEHEMLSILLKG